MSASGTIFVADGSIREGEEGRTSFFGLIREVTPNGSVGTLAGAMDADGGHLDGIGHEAAFNIVSAITMDAAGNLFVTEEGDIP